MIIFPQTKWPLAWCQETSLGNAEPGQWHGDWWQWLRNKNKILSCFKTDCRIRIVVAGLCNGDREACMWQYPLMREVLGCFWKSLWTGCAAELPDFFTERGHTTQPFSKEAKYTCNSGYGSEICLQITSLQFV